MRQQANSILTVVAITAVISLILMIAAGSSCGFVHAAAVPGAVVEVLDPAYGFLQTTASFGIFCSGGLMDLQDDDVIWKLCQVFYSAALVFATLSTVIAVTIVCCHHRPVVVLWQTVSVLAAGSALLCVPVFLLLESNPCTDFPEQQSCHFGPIAYCLGTAIGLWLLVAFWTQWFDPPLAAASKPRTLWKRAVGCLLLNNNDNDTERRGGPRRWFPLDDDDDSESNAAAEWAPDEEEGLIGAAAANPVAEPTTPFLKEQVLGRLVTAPASVVEGESASDTAVLLLQGDSTQTSVSPLMANTNPLEDLLDTDEETPSEFSLSGPAVVVYQDLEREAPHRPPSDDCCVVVETSSEDGSSVKQQEEETLIKLTYSPDINNLPSLLDRASEQSQDTHSSSSTNDDHETSQDDDDVPHDTGDLGSLEPSSGFEDTVVVTGDESILDNQQQQQQSVDSPEDKVPAESPSLADDQPLLTTLDEAMEQKASLEQLLPHEVIPTSRPNGRLADAMKKVMHKPVDLGRSIFPGRRKKKALGRYRLMDDTNLESSLPISPPLEIVTMTMIDDAGLDLGLDDDDKLEEEFDDIWDEMERMVSPPPKYTQQDESSKKIPKTFEPDPVPKASGAKQSRKKNRRRKRRSKRRGSPTEHSLSSSSGSLLSYTIPEESESDLDDSDEERETQPEAQTFDPYGSPIVDPLPLTKSQSAPNLAVFDQPVENTGGWALEDEKVKKVVPAYPVADNMSRGSSRMKEEEGETSPRSVTHFDHGDRSVVTMPEESPIRRLPLFRAEREMREGIHSTGGLTSDSSSAGVERTDLKSLPSFRSLKSYNARVARIRRLQLEPASPGRCMGVVPPAPIACVSPEHSNTHKGARGGTCLTFQEKSSPTPMPQDLPPRPPPVSPSEHSRSIGDYTYESGATLDELSAELAILLRPDGLLQGPDERMV